MKHLKRRWFIFLTAAVLFFCQYGALAISQADLQTAVDETAAHLYQSVPNPQFGVIGGEWAILGMARSGYRVPDAYYQSYYNSVADYVKKCEGKLHNRKYTEYSRLILALTAIGKDPTNVAGYNLLEALGDYEKTVWQGINGPVWALIALDSGNYAMPENKEASTQATREMYVAYILSCQLEDGGWALLSGTDDTSSQLSDPDITGMALQALAPYQNQPEVKLAIEQALECMAQRQLEDGGFESWNEDNCESCVQMIVALCELGVSLTDDRFVKNGNTILDYLMRFYRVGGGFVHTVDNNGNANEMATEQGFYGIVAANRALQGQSSLYQMSDISQSQPDNPIELNIGLEGKHEAVTLMPISQPGKTFADIASHENQAAIEALAARAIINGKSDDVFEPDATMTRAEFAAIVVKGLGLPVRGEAKFEDVSADAWYFPYINTAYAYGIVTGTSETLFTPDGTITREEAAVMTARAAKLCGMDTQMEGAAVRDVLAGFVDYVHTSNWAQNALAFCFRENILPSEAIEILPKEKIRRCEIAQMLFQMLEAANLL